MKIFLIGFMAAGKTTLGRLLADKLEWKFIDLDERIESQEDRSIPEIFETYGEDFFRILEAEALRIVSLEPGNCIIACGGGKMGTKSGDAYVTFALPEKRP